MDFCETNICILCITRPVLSIKCVFSTINFLYSKVFSISNVQDKHFCVVLLFEKKNACFKITMFSTYIKHRLTGCVLNQFCITRRYFNTCVPVCVFLPNLLLSYCTYASLTLIWKSCQMSVEVISATYHLILFCRINSTAEARICIMGKTFGPEVTFAIDVEKICNVY